MIIPSSTLPPATAVSQLYARLRGGAPPSCVNAVSTSCPQLQTTASSCVPNGTNNSPQSCFCPTLSNSSCADICRKDGDTADYLRWALSLCNNYSLYDGANHRFTQIWKDFGQLEHTAYLNLFPWSWVVQYNAKYDHRPQPLPGQPPLGPLKCPSQLTKLLSFALINISVFIISLYLGRRTVIHKLSFGKLGDPKGSGMWIVASVFFLGLSIAANFLNAHLVRSTPGFGSVPLGDLMLLRCSRPRIAWATAILVFVDKEKGMYFTTGASALISEMVLQLLGAVYLGRTVHFAALRGFYRIGHGDHLVVGWKNAHIMYAGALLWIVPVGLALLQIIYSFSGLKDLVQKALQSIGKQWVKATRNRRASVKIIILKRLTRWIITWIDASRNIMKGHSYFLNRKRPGEIEIELHTQDAQVSESQHPQNTGYRYDWQIALERMGLTVAHLESMRKVVFLMIVPFTGQWLFWAGYIRLAGEL
jgi:hypothetical protein